MGKRLFQFFRIWGNLVIVAITVYPFVLTYFFPPPTQGGDLTSLFGWSWQTWLIILLVSIIFTLFVQNLFEKYEKESPAQTTKTNSATNGGIAMQDVKTSQVIKDSFNTNWPPLDGYAVPTRQQLTRRIGVDIQRFDEQFKSIRRKSAQDKYDQWIAASKILEMMRTELLPHANIELKSTPIPDLLREVHRQLSRYSSEIAMLSQDESDRAFYGRTRAGVPKDVLDRISQTRDFLQQLDGEIDSMVIQLIDLATEDPWTSY